VTKTNHPSSAKSITLIFPHQLFTNHPAISADRPIQLIEDSLFFGDPHVDAVFHLQKIILLRASMRHYHDELTAQGHNVTLISWRANWTITDHLQKLAEDGVTDIHYCDPMDYLLSRRIARAAERHSLQIHQSVSPMFLTPSNWADDFFAKRKKSPIMADFYRAQRQRMNLLIDSEGQPVGGKWSHDEDNRKKLPTKATVPLTINLSPLADIKSLIASISNNGPPTRGKADEFTFPTTRRQALLQLDDFLDKRFEKFGDYEDAIHTDYRILYHSLLTPTLNIGLITPDEVVERALNAIERKNIPLNSAEGFIRQIIGWREYMAQMYQRHGTSQRTSNFWNFEKRGIPDAFYTGKTGIPPVDEVIARLDRHAYAHHIERLMVLGNFMLLCRIHPNDVYRWFMEMFIDAYDWVMVPNVYAMSQFADGGSFTTKPYISGSNYIRKMSNWPKGDWCETWDGLFWTFIDDYQEEIAANHRMSMMAASLRRMADEKRAAHRSKADEFFTILWSK